jgi:hypothetical protein
MTTNREWGPLAALIGEWEGDEGLDVSFHNATGKVAETKFRERATFAPFGPVANGPQQLWGLDYRMAAWRLNEENPFHTEIGYWLWDGATGEVLRCFMVPRGSTTIAGGTAAIDATTFDLAAKLGDESYGVLSAPYLAKNARTTKYTCTVRTEGGLYAYESCTTYHHVRGGEIAHTDRNRLKKVG